MRFAGDLGLARALVDAVPSAAAMLATPGEVELRLEGWPDEVEEETGLRCRTLDELPETRYVDRHGRPKRVRYWSMQVDAELGFAPNDELDDLCWLSRDDARKKLSYLPDREVLDALQPRADR